MGAGIGIVATALIFGVIGMYINGQGTDLPQQESSSVTAVEEIPYTDDQLYAVAYIGYDEYSSLDGYIAQYLPNQNPPFFHLSQGEYYLVIPRYSQMELNIYRNDMETMGSALLYKSPTAHPFVIQGNISDIFSNMTIELTDQEQSTSFSPYISLKDGGVEVGDRGLDITNQEEE